MQLPTIVLMVLVLGTVIVDARRSRIDLPIALAADAPLHGDNVATASGTDAVTVKVAAPPSSGSLATAAQTPLDGEAALETHEIRNDLSGTDGESASGAEADGAVQLFEDESEECDPDMIGFEIVTG